MAVTVEGQVSFSRVGTNPELGRVDFIAAAADINGDGRDDIVAGGLAEYRDTGAPDDRFTKAPLHILVGKEDGGFAHAPELVEGTIEARNAHVVVADFNSDSRADLAVFDGGVYVNEESVGYGNPPQLWLSDNDGVLRPSEGLADAVRAEHALRPPAGKGLSAPADLHLKSVTSGDIDGDGDIDLWVDSIGGKNVSSHFMVNNGDGTFTVDEARAPHELRHNPSPEYWYHLEGRLVDLDNDGDIDLSLGQSRGNTPDVINQYSIVLVNDGTGHYLTRIELPHPAFNEGYTSVTGQTHFDVNSDGFQDLLLVHTRNNDALSDVLPFTGRYIQVLINDSGTSFVDETSTRMGDQSATTSEYDSDGDPLYNAGHLVTYDVDRDGCADLVVSKNWNNIRTESPLVYRNDGSGRLRAMSPVPFAETDRYFGWEAVPADVNGDTVVDFVVPQHDNGPDSVLLFNDGTGHYPTRFELPHPSFNEGYTRVFGIVDFDLNEDSAGDMLMLHVRNDVDGGWSGRYIQALLSTDGGTAFVDETSTWVSDQSATTPRINQDGDQLFNLGQLRVHDVDLDGCEDLVVFAARAHIRVESPLVYRNNGSGQFQAMSPEPFAGDDEYFGRHAVSADVNGDAVIDFVVPHHNEGPDEEWGTDDDFTTFITLVNTTSPQPVRCE